MNVVPLDPTPLKAGSNCQSLKFTKNTVIKGLTTLISSLALVQGAAASDLVVISQGTFASAFRALVPQFEHETGDKIIYQLGNPGVTLDRIRKAEPPADVVIVSTSTLNVVLAEGLADPKSQREIGHSKIGMAVPANTPLPVIRDVAGFTRFIRSVQSIALVDPNGGSGTSPPFIAAIERLGLAPEVAPKYKYYQGTGENVAEAVAAREADVGVTSVSELMPNKGVAVIGALPNDVLDRSTITYGLIGAKARQREEAARFIDFLRSPVAVQALVSIGLE